MTIDQPARVRYRSGFMGRRTATLVIIGALALTSCGGGDDKPTLTGSFTLTDDEIDGDWDDCSGTGGYDDFGPGMNVTVRDGSGNIIATTATRSVTGDDIPVEDDADDSTSVLGLTATLAELRDGRDCTVWFETEVDRADFYAVEVGRRGDLTYSIDEMEEADWHVGLTLG